MQCSAVQQEGERGARRKAQDSTSWSWRSLVNCAARLRQLITTGASSHRESHTPAPSLRLEGSRQPALQAASSRPKAPPQPGSPLELDTNGPNRLEADGVHGDGDGDDGDAHASATFHKPRRRTGRLCTGSAVLAAATNTCQHLAAL